MNSLEPPASFTSALSPMHSSGVSPWRSVAATLRRVVPTVSPRCSRRPECPLSTIRAPPPFACGPETSPVHAPASAQCAFWTPSSAGESSPRISRTVVVAVNEGITKGCTLVKGVPVPAVGPVPPAVPALSAVPVRWLEAASGARASRRPSAQVRASARVLVIFQLVPTHRVLMSLLGRAQRHGAVRNRQLPIQNGARHGAGPDAPALRRGRAPPCPAAPGSVWSGLVEGAVVGADGVDLRGRGGLRIELQIQPHLHQLLRGL